ncbi:hypothetical protein L596_007647 [Steinernema carpocapsae]|uniref:Uncharacterized protein n=1 Tax=Steinernema carpocapsae TaxID=34508 RepID=A0A4U5PA50_STECR|nr:hypothetical protein L596_007647 [Steinernema carpocapsae]
MVPRVAIDSQIPSACPAATSDSTAPRRSLLKPSLAQTRTLDPSSRILRLRSIVKSLSIPTRHRSFAQRFCLLSDVAGTDSSPVHDAFREPENAGVCRKVNSPLPQ